MKPEIAFIGGGNMATSLVGGLVAGGKPAASILVSEPDHERRALLESDFGVQTTDSNTDALQADVVVLAVKPQVMQTVCRGLAGERTANEPLYLSIAAGIRTGDIERWLGGEHKQAIALVRCMPNTPSLLQCGATALYSNMHSDTAQKAQAQSIMEAVGLTVWVDHEALLDVVTALSGSGPAYFFLLMETMQAAANKLGLDAVTASTLAIQTALGAARMASESDVSPAVLRERVTSKGGTTAAALAAFERGGLADIVEQALNAAHERSREIALELGKDN